MPKVLLVEDDEQLAGFLMRFLSSEGYTTSYAAGQKDALKLFEENKYDCILLDISLKDGSGYSVCAAVKAVDDTPVIFITASADEACTVAGFEIGADDYIGKPFGTRELLARMKNVMRRHQKTSSLLKCGDVTIDPIKGIVLKNGSELAMSALEYRLLLVFFSNKNQMLSRDRLSEELWSLTKEFVSDNTLSVYIKRLREKIEDDPQNPSLIVTVRGLGYKAVDG
ncbi:MAG: response regulator transcription factor [Oscillospiraceae bacterium]|nr:response regulator transcription factor [Oscillospiraceae bacterium]MBR3024710.1 response regulator transcription factor [Oscillospiraceae bacterium]MBR3534338.1 response regulator transcription factor [Oscillospiraceae bacterium]